MTTPLTPPDAQLRRELFEMCLPVAGDYAVELARAAYDFIVGPTYVVQFGDPRFPPIESDDEWDAVEQVLAEEETGDPSDAPGWDAIIMPGDEPAGDEPAQAPEPAGLVAHQSEATAIVAHADAPVIDNAPPSAEKPAKTVVWTEERRKTLADLCGEGLTAKEIAERMGLANAQLVHGNAGRFGLTAMWREARERRQAQQQPAPVAQIDEVPAAADGVELPAPAVEVRPDPAEAAALALEGDRPGFPVQSRSLAEVETIAEPPRHAAAPLVTIEAEPDPEDRTRTPRRFAGATTKDTKHLPGDVQAEKAAERALIEQEMDRGTVKITKVVTAAHHPGGEVTMNVVIAYLRNDDVVVDIGKNQWLVNGNETLGASDLLLRANHRRRRRRLELFQLVK